MTVLTGLDHLLDNKLDLVSRKRVGLVTNAAAVTHDLKSNTDALRAAGVNLVALFSPEHGLAAADDHGVSVASSRDARTGLPIFSLYGDTYQPTREMLSGVDLLLFDLQDVGVRFYTYSYTLGKVLEACAESIRDGALATASRQSGVPLIVLDRPNPIRGDVIDGPLLDPDLQSTVGYGSIPLRYGLTMGELARFYNAELHLGAELHVVPLKGWRRSMWQDETGHEWVPPSPSMPHLSTAILYPGTCLIEGTNLSAGRGTPLPFEVVGAPWLDGYALASEMNAQHFPGVHFRPTTFTPTGDKFAGITCSGVQVHVLDRETMRPVSIALSLIALAKELNPAEFAWQADHFDKLIGKRRVRDRIDRGDTTQEIERDWHLGQKQYVGKWAQYLLYDVES